MNWLNYHHLFYFKTIATEGSIARAAEKLRIGQPAISMQLRRLEESLGKPLFERRNRGLVLTEAGKLTLEYANDIFRLGDEMQEALQDRLGTDRVQLQIGALDSVPKYLLSLLSKEALSGGSCTVSILEGRGDELMRELAAHKIDLLIANYPAPVGEQHGFRSRSIARLPVSVYGVERFKKLKKDFPASLEGQPFILPTSHSKLRQDLEHYFKVNHIHIDAVADTQDTSVQNLLAQDGLGLIAQHEVAMRDLVAERKLFPLGSLPGVEEELWLISAARLFKDFRVGAASSAV
jgi:LysR family transcriptional activator of nhaA